MSDFNNKLVIDLFDERDALRAENEALKERVKRLEEAGDAMINEGWNEPHLANAWRKAKEAKP